MAKATMGSSLRYHAAVWLGCATVLVALAACSQSQSPQTPPATAPALPPTAAEPAPRPQESAPPPTKDGHAAAGPRVSRAAPGEKRDAPPGIGAVGAGTGSGQRSGELKIGSAATAGTVPPPFPWPPPQASAEQSIPDKWLRTGPHPTLARVAGKLDKALRLAHYPQSRYYSVPHGFALATHLEHIEADGAPLSGPDRWRIGTPSLANLSLFEFVKALARAPAGEYRAIVFIVTDAEWRPSETPASESVIRAWASGGLEALPPSIGTLPYERGYRTQALIYQLRKRAGQEAQFVLPSALTGEEHLDKGGLWEPLSIL